MPEHVRDGEYMRFRINAATIRWESCGQKVRHIAYVIAGGGACIMMVLV